MRFLFYSERSQTGWSPTTINKTLKKARQHWNSIFPIEEDQLYIKAVAKIEQKKVDLEQLEKELEELTASHAEHPNL